MAEKIWSTTMNDPSTKTVDVSKLCKDVTHPSHYTQGKIECIDYIVDKKLDFCLGNAIKYITRAGHKASAEMSQRDKTVQDLEKAKQYIDFEIQKVLGDN